MFMPLWATWADSSGARIVNGEQLPDRADNTSTPTETGCVPPELVDKRRWQQTRTRDHVGPPIYRESSPVLMITAVTSKPSALDDEGRRFQPPGHRSQKDVNDGDDEVAGSDDLGIQPKIHQFKCPQDVAAQYVKLIAAEVLLACDDH